MLNGSSPHLESPNLGYFTTSNHNSQLYPCHLLSKYQELDELLDSSCSLLLQKDYPYWHFTHPKEWYCCR